MNMITTATTTATTTEGMNITVNMPVTYKSGTDYYAGRVSKIFTDKKIEIELVDNDKVWNVMTWTKRRSGLWVEQHSKMYAGFRLIFGKAFTQLDEGF